MEQKKGKEFPERKEFDWGKYINELFSEENPNNIIEKLKYGFNTYPLPFSIPITIHSEYFSEPPIKIYCSNTSNGHKLEFLSILEVKNESNWNYDNRRLVGDWIKRKMQFYNENRTFDENAKKREQQQPPESIPDNINPQNTYSNRVIIQWNEQKNVLTDIFRQLKRITNKEGKPIIGNSIEEIALFLRDNFSCFENTKLSTIQYTLKNSEFDLNTPKTSRRINIEKEKD